jgi:methyl-accepting chemotaxis protein
MKNWTVGKRLISSFLAVAAITMLLGFVGYYGAVKSKEAMREIGGVRLPSVQSLLIISEQAELIKAAQRALLNPDLNPSDRQRQTETEAKARMTYEAAWKIYEPLPQTTEEAAIWKEFVPAWEAWQAANNDFFKINTNLEAMGINDPKALERDLFEVRGLFWKTISSLTKQVKEGGVLTETDTINTLLSESAGDWTVKITSSNPQIQKSLQEIRPLNTAVLAGVRKVQGTYARGEQAAARELLEKEVYPNTMKIIELMRPMRAEAAKATALRDKLNFQLMTVCQSKQETAIVHLERLVKINGDVAADTVKSATSQASTLQRLNLTTMIIAAVVALALGLLITKGINRILNRISAALYDGASQVVSAAGQVSSSSQSLAEGASEQASSLEETSASLEEMASMTKRNAENARSANSLAKQAREAADKGASDMQTMAAAMAAIKVSSDDIAKIIKTIDEIAFQTNILALNAAVEAARAGEAGMGFAVVADEVRNLAQRAAQAAKETSAKIEGAITKTSQGVEISAKVAAVLNEIVTKARQVDELVTEVAGASREQTDGITQINTAVGQMDKVTQNNAANAEESAAAAQELNAQAETMKHSVAELLQLVNGGKGGSLRPTASGAREKTPAKPSATRPAAIKTAKPTPMPSPATNGHGTHETKLTAQRRSEIPMGDDFKDF